MFRPAVQRALAQTRPIAIGRVATLASAASTSSSASFLARRWASTEAASEPKIHHDISTLSTHVAPGQVLDPQLHGYPQLPFETLQNREPFGWWDRQERKNFGEVFHEEEDALSMWSPDVHKISGGSALLQIAVAFSVVGVASYFLYVTRIERPVAKRSYPYNGLEKELGGHVLARAEEVEVDDE